MKGTWVQPSHSLAHCQDHGRPFKSDDRRICFACCWCGWKCPEHRRSNTQDQHFSQQEER